MKRDVKMLIIGIVASGIIALVITAYFSNSTPQNIGNNSVQNSPRTIINSGSGNIVINSTFNNENKNGVIHNLQATDYQDGEHGNQYVDKLGGYVIEKPSEKWYFVKNSIKYRQSLNMIIPQDLISGVFVNRIDTVSIAVQVYKKSVMQIPLNSTFFPGQISRLSEVNHIPFSIVKNEVSTDEDYGYAEFLGKNSTMATYDIEIIQIYANKTYVITVSSYPPSMIPDDVKKEINSVIDSFKIFS